MLGGHSIEFIRKMLLNMCTAFGLNILNEFVMATYRVVIHMYIILQIA